MDPAADMDMTLDTDIETQSILLAAANHDVRALRALLSNRAGSANVQDPETGATPLHAAIAACEPDAEGDDTATAGAASANGAAANGVTHVNGAGGDAATVTAEEAGKESEREKLMEEAGKTVKLLLQHGAIWNDLDANGETPGCIARRLGLKELYDLMVDAGVRAELLLGRLDEYQPLGDGDGEGDEDDAGEDENEGRVAEGGDAEQAQGTVESGNATVASAQEPSQDQSQQNLTNSDVNNAKYLASNLTFTADRLLDADANGVMMSWETNLMSRSAELLTPTEGLRILNVGHGMSIIDTEFQKRKPSMHHIVEAHPAVLERMKRDGWYEKPGIVVHEGRWQDVVPQLVEENVMFDAIYFDTFAEDYRELREFFSEYVIGLLDPVGGKDGEGGKFGFFNGLGADRQICYDIYSKIVELDIYEAGLDIEWEDVKIGDLDASGEWSGVRRRYWIPDKYRLPTCTFLG
ncbi:putative arginine N-methyltransferase [Lineolata rhizophorae]|uniref:Arginine N-methyltransferase 2 n=1 Tax=Lineolata rhizophorae TaxID=578093 RepID=A0A6A6P0X7_9PEZI|nr:putative arginine N-methyltransferase [Lineolata rhizophorae]